MSEQSGAGNIEANQQENRAANMAGEPLGPSFSQQIFSQIFIEEELDQLTPPENRAAFIPHIVLKIIPISLFLMDTFLATLFNKDAINQLILIFVVAEFWITKNVTGRKMIGLKWSYEQIRGTERLKIESRVNEELVNSLTFKIFWILQISYVLLPFIFFVAQIFIAPNVSNVDLRVLALNLIIFTGGIANLLMFFKASVTASDQQAKIRWKLGTEFIRKMQMASIITYF